MFLCMYSICESPVYDLFLIETFFYREVFKSSKPWCNHSFRTDDSKCKSIEDIKLLFFFPLFVSFNVDLLRILIISSFYWDLTTISKRPSKFGYQNSWTWKCICWYFTIIFFIFNSLICDAFERFKCNIFVNDHQYLFHDKICSSPVHLIVWLNFVNYIFRRLE